MRPLQPCKSDAVGMGWMLGSQDDPPCCILPTAKGEVTVSLQKKPPPGLEEPTIWSSTKTRALLRKAVANPSGPQDIKHNVARSGTDPWTLGSDPWGQYKPVSMPSSSNGDVPMHAVTMMDSMETRLKAQLATHSATAADPRLDKLETDMNEMKAQGQKFEHWFQDAGNQNRAMKTQMDNLVQQVAVQDQALQNTHGRIEEMQVQANRRDVSQLQSSIQSGFANIEALLSKKQRAE